MPKTIDVAGIAEKAYQTGFRYEKEKRGCGQCTVAAVYDTLHWEYDAIFKALSGIAGGIGMVNDGNCGAYIAGALILGNRVGRERNDFEDKVGRRFEAYRLARKLRERFIEKYRQVTCGQIHSVIFGRQFNLLDSDQMAEFDQMGGHSSKCPDVVGEAARWIIEILAEEGLLEER
jgi:Putative redox-active protein (C_GCAxxG_C_C)